MSNGILIQDWIDQLINLVQALVLLVTPAPPQVPENTSLETESQIEVREEQQQPVEIPETLETLESKGN